MSDEERLTDAERELEAALRSLRPMPAPTDPTGAALATCRRRARRRATAWRGAIVGAALAAAVGIWLTLLPGGDLPDRVDRRPPRSVHGRDLTIKSRVGPPTLIAYRAALARSTARFEALLDHQASMGAAPVNHVTPVGMLTHWDANGRPSLGDL